MNSKCIQNGGQHAHVIGARTFHAVIGTFDTTENIAATNDEAQLNADRQGAFNVGADALDGFNILTILLVAHQRFTGNFQ